MFGKKTHISFQNIYQDLDENLGYITHKSSILGLCRPIVVSVFVRSFLETHVFQQRVITYLRFVGWTTKYDGDYNSGYNLRCVLKRGWWPHLQPWVFQRLALRQLLLAPGDWWICLLTKCGPPWDLGTTCLVKTRRGKRMFLAVFQTVFMAGCFGCWKRNKLDKHGEHFMLITGNMSKAKWIFAQMALFRCFNGMGMFLCWVIKTCRAEYILWSSKTQIEDVSRLLLGMVQLFLQPDVSKYSSILQPWPVAIWP